MTGKRFTSRNGVFYTDTKTGYEFQCYGEVADMMNELADENEQLKSKLESAEKVLHNIGYELVYSKTYEKWVIE